MAFGVTSHVHRALGGALRDERPDDEPAVVVLAAPVDEFEPSARRVLDGHPLRVRLRGDHQPLACPERRGLVLALRIERPGAIGLAREDAALRVGRPGPAEEDAGEQLHVEPDLADPLVGQRLFEIDDDAEGPARWPDTNRVGELQVRVLNRVEALPVLVLVWVLRAQADLARGLVDNPLADLGHGLPLAWRAIEAEVAVGCHAPAVLDDADASLMALRVVVVGQHHVEPRHLQGTRDR